MYYNRKVFIFPTCIENWYAFTISCIMFYVTLSNCIELTQNIYCLLGQDYSTDVLQSSTFNLLSLSYRPKPSYFHKYNILVIPSYFVITSKIFYLCNMFRINHLNCSNATDKGVHHIKFIIIHNIVILKFHI